VRHEGKEHRGFLAEYDLDKNFAVVNVRTFLDVHVEFSNVHCPVVRHLLFGVVSLAS